MLDLRATTDPVEAYAGAELVVVAMPTNYDHDWNFFDTSAVEFAIDAVRFMNPGAWAVVKLTVPVGNTERLRAERGDKFICLCIFRPIEVAHIALLWQLLQIIPMMARIFIRQIIVYSVNKEVRYEISCTYCIS